jgi:hypothetical protein
VYTPRLFCWALAGIRTETDPGSAAVVVVTPDVVEQTTTGNDAVTIGTELVVGVVDGGDVTAVEVDVDVEDLDADADVVVVRFGWVDPDPDPDPEDPHAVNNRATPATIATKDPARIRRIRPIRPIRPTANYASTVRSASRSAKRFCASAARVGMCSLGTSWGEYPFKTRRATVWRCTSSGPS